MDFLLVHNNIPIEREFEAWVVRGIENYLERLGVAYSVFAVSPAEESTWPADEALQVGGKLVGFQVKRPNLASRAQIVPNDFSRLYWSFHQPPGQMGLVSAQPEIVFALPTFTNRSLRNQALDHCLFWSPPNDSDKTAWYKNTKKNVQTQYNDLSTAPRWGKFAEGLFECTEGLVLGERSVSDYLAEVRETLLRHEREESAEAKSFALYYFSLRVAN